MDVTVIIPIYNQESYLEECLESVVDQNNRNYEVILINDGSTDKSEYICQKYAEKYSCFRYFYQQSAGLGAARNTGLAHARGKYLLFLDSDDTIQRNCIGKVFSFAKGHAADIVYFDEIVCDENLSVCSIAKTYPEMDVRILKRTALEFSMQPSHICARLYRRSLFDDLRFPDIWYEDMEIFPQLLAKAERLYYYKVPIYYYRQHRRGITYQNEDKRNLDAVTAWYNAYTKTDCSREEREALEISIKKSVFTFIFFRPKYATAYVKFYNRFFAERSDIFLERTWLGDVDIHHMPLWQQADFYGQKEILESLTGLKDIYQYGGLLQFHESGGADFYKENIQEEEVVFSSTEDIALKEMKMQRGNPAVYEMIKDCARWNLISLKNQMKEFKIAELVLEKAILNGIKLNERSFGVIKKPFCVEDW